MPRMHNIPEKKRLLQPGTIVQYGMAVIDHQHRVRTLPSSEQGRKKMLDGILRKFKRRQEESLARQELKGKKSKMPNFITRSQLLIILADLKFKGRKLGKRGSTIIYNCPGYPHVNVTSGPSKSRIGINNNPVIKNLVNEWLKNGHSF